MNRKRLQNMLLVFDLDGTLIDSRRDLCTGINLMRRHYGLPPLPLKTVSQYVGDGIRKLVSRALHDAPGIDPDEAVQKNSECYRAHLHDETTLYPGVAAGLPQLAGAGRQLALISNKPRQSCLDLLEHFGVRELFAMVMGGDSTANLKPHPETLQTVMRELSRAPAETWMIGDSVNDLACARHAGAHSVFVSYGIGQSAPETPDLVFDAFPDLTAYFLKACLLTGRERPGSIKFNDIRM